MPSDASFLPAPQHPTVDPHDELLLRDAHRSLAVTFHADVEHQRGPIRLERVGFADIPCLTVPVICKQRDVQALIPALRQLAFGYLAERGVGDEHLRFVPTVSVGRRTRFTSQSGAGRMGERCEVRFELSRELAARVQWQGRQGTLRAAWEDGAR